MIYSDIVHMVEYVIIAALVCRTVADVASMFVDRKNAVDSDKLNKELENVKARIGRMEMKRAG